MTSFVAIDFETANEFRGSPCAVALVAVQNNKVVERYTTLIQPPPSVARFSGFCVSLHGITAAHVRDAPTWPQALEDIAGFVDGRPVVAHNAAFDMGVIRSACDEMGIARPTLKYACSLVVARRTWPLLSYSLPWVCEAAGYQLVDHHDPVADAEAAAAVMMAAKGVHGSETLIDLLAGLQVRFGELLADQWSGCQFIGGRSSSPRSPLPGANLAASTDGPFWGLSVCFTGTLTSMTRDQASHALATVGGQPVDGVSRKTDVLVIGMQDQRRFAPGSGMSTKHQKAATLLQKGHSIEVISEVDFLQRLSASEASDRTS
jgi:DNA polymerase III epsilon subunit-like protein